MENLKLDDSFRGPKQSLYDQDCITVFIRMNGFWWNYDVKFHDQDVMALFEPDFYQIEEPAILGSSNESSN